MANFKKAIMPKDWRNFSGTSKGEVSGNTSRLVKGIMPPGYRGGIGKGQGQSGQKVTTSGTDFSKIVKINQEPNTQGPRYQLNDPNNQRYQLNTQIIPRYNLPNIPFRPGEQVSLTNLFKAIGKKPEEVFSLSDLRQVMDEQRRAGGDAVAVDAPRFQTPEQLVQLISQINEMMSPLTQLQQQAAISGFNQAMNQLRNQWAARGLLASGAAAAQEGQAVQSLAGQLAQIEAEQQARAIPLALDYARLGLQESAQRFDQQMANRRFDLERAQQAVSNMLSALGLQEEQLQNYLNNLRQATQMQIEQNQWAQEFGLRRQAEDFNRWLQTMRLNEDARQFDVNASLENNRLNEQARQFDISAALQTARLNEEARQFDINTALREGELTGRYLPQQARALINDLRNVHLEMLKSQNDPKRMQELRDRATYLRQQLAILGIDPRQFDRAETFSELLGRFANAGISTLDQQRLQEEQRQFNTGTALDLSRIFGIAVQPSNNVADMFKQVSGRPTLETQRSVLNAVLDAMRLTPTIPRGAGNAISGFPGMQNLANFLNSLGGRETQRTWEVKQDYARWAQEFAFEKEMREKAYQLEKIAMEQELNYKRWLQQRGISEDRARQATNRVLSDIIGWKAQGLTLDEVYRRLTQSQGGLIQDGVNIAEVFNFIGQVYGVGSSSSNLMGQLRERMTGLRPNSPLSSAPPRIQGYAEQAARATGLPVELIGAVMKVESGFNPNAKSPAGAIGLMQLMPATAKSLGVNPYDPLQNVLGGARYLAQQLQRFGDLRLALAAYNAGPGRVQQAISKAGSRDWSKVSRYLPKETQNYVAKVLSYYG